MVGVSLPPRRPSQVGESSPIQIPSAIVNGSSTAVPLNKTTSVHGQRSLLGTIDSSVPRLRPRLALLRLPVEDASRVPTTVQVPAIATRGTDPTPTPLTTAHSGRLPGPGADSSAPGCAARA